MGWVLRLVEIGEGSGRSVDVMEISRPGDVGNLAALGLTLSQGKQLVALVQQEIVAPRAMATIPKIKVHFSTQHIDVPTYLAEPFSITIDVGERLERRISTTTQNSVC